MAAGYRSVFLYFFVRENPGNNIRKNMGKVQEKYGKMLDREEVEWYIIGVSSVLIVLRQLNALIRLRTVENG